MRQQCDLVDIWLHTTPEATDPGLPPGKLVAHVADCPRCRLGLLTLLADRIAPTAPPADQRCTLIEAQLPAFVDYEQAHGLIMAARTFPAVWWHTLVCPDCDDLYRTLHDLAVAPAPPLVGVLAQARSQPTIRAQLQIHPGVIRQFLSARTRLGAAWGEPESEVIIAEQQGEIGLIQVSLRQEPPASLTLVIRTKPPIEGVMELALGDACYSDVIDSLGCVVFSGLDQALFSRGNGQQIMLRIRPPDA